MNNKELKKKKITLAVYTVLSIYFWYKLDLPSYFIEDYHKYLARWLAYYQRYILVNSPGIVYFIHLVIWLVFVQITRRKK